MSRPPEEIASEANGDRRWVRPGWPLYLVCALLYGLYLGLNQLIGLGPARGDFAAWKPFVWETSSVLVIVGLIPLIIRYEARFRLDARPRSRIFFAHLAGAVVFSVVHTSGMVALRKIVYALAGEHYDFGSIALGGFYELQKDVVSYLIILIVVFAFREFRARRAGELRAAALAAELSNARLQHLTAQIEPHFLFNSLNAISNRMHEDVDAADRMIAQLGDLLRAAYESDRSLLVPLAREIDWLRGYAAMMGERFRGQLAFQVQVEVGLEALLVPRMLLQPVVENALRHGLREGRGWLEVDVRRADGRLQYKVSDDGVGLPDPPRPEAVGTGLANIARRLELLFPAEHSFRITGRSPRGVEVTLSFPVTT